MIINRLLIFLLIYLFNFKLINNENIPLEILSEIFSKAAAQLEQFKLSLKSGSDGAGKHLAKRDVSNRNASLNRTNLRNDDSRPPFHRLLTQTTPESLRVHDMFLVALHASKSLHNDSRFSNRTLKIKLKAPPQFCPFSSDIDCDPSSKYRAIDGSCNNLKSPMLGRSSTPYKRYMKTAYEDGLNEPRSRSSMRKSRPLPNPRSISMAVHEPLDTPTKLSNMGVMFGQYIDHDFAMTSAASSSRCSCETSSSDCLNIMTPDDDLINADQSCMVLTRSGASFQKFNCDLDFREQLNLLTHFLDMSQIYGNDASEERSLRSFSNGRLQTSKIARFKREFLPHASPGTCAEETGERLCFNSGDRRTSQNMMLVSVHTVWLREHNRIAKVLKKLNPTWSDEDLYQEARRITVAEYQNIIYSEWLPVLLGRKVMVDNSLSTMGSGYFLGYDQDTNPSLSSEFSTAAFRFGHSLIRSFLAKTNKNLKQFANITLTSIMLRPTEAYVSGGLDAICRGLLVDPATSFDNHITDEVQNHLFETSIGPTFRFSLSAINIMRGRDHGLPPYNEFRKFAGLSEAKLFKHLVEIPRSTRVSLRKIYGNVHDIDAFTGGVSETPIQDSLLGPTFAFIVARQFKELKTGDRFYFENGHDNATKFSLPQLDEIRKSSMASIMCENLDLSLVQKKAFESIGENNTLVDCASIPRVNLTLWKNEPLKLERVETETTTTFSFDQDFSFF